VSRVSVKFAREWVRRAVQLAALLAFVYLVVAAPWLNIGWLPSQLFSRLDPLVGLTAVIASRALMAYAALGLVTMAFTFVLGRVWCGWLCPLGTLIELTPSRSGRAANHLPAWWRYGKYAVFALVLGAAIFGTLAPMVLDPITIAMRPLQEIVMPLLGSDAVGVSVGQYLSRDAMRLVAWLSMVPLVVVLALNAVTRRFWCRALCPLGGMVAVGSAASLVRRQVDIEACTRCGKCSRECPTSAISPKLKFTSSPSECIVCLHCTDVCPTAAISFGPVRMLAPLYVPERRETLIALGATGASLAGVLLLPRAAQAKELLRPPGTTEQRLAERCVRCGACYAACPTGALRPSTSAISPAGLWTPVLDERPVHCTMDCNLCAPVCPTDALHTPTDQEAIELGLGGFAVVDKTRCIAWTRGKSCLKCTRFCPISGAIGSTPVVVNTHFGPKETRVPVVTPELCVACGLCTDSCPVQPAAIVVRR
ncbi:MAG: 4Fe-4S binding protein, partial [Actinomycetota bacterium]|nr:4Fe-4S binding protein [Actinomycetota bacterium]